MLSSDRHAQQGRGYFLIPDNHLGWATVSSVAVAHEVEAMGGLPDADGEIIALATATFAAGLAKLPTTSGAHGRTPPGHPTAVPPATSSPPARAPQPTPASVPPPSRADR